MAKAILTQARLKELLHYDPATGFFTWLVNRRGPVKAGDTAVRKNRDGYVVVGVDCGRYLAHRLAWLYMLGCFPAKGIDHRDGCRSNNAWANLREADQAQNMQNTLRVRKGNVSGYLGVNWDKARGKWLARIASGGKGNGRNLGRFDTPEEAHAAYLKAKRELHPFWDEDNCK